MAVPLIERALDLGVNYIDTSSIYGGPERWSEHYVGQVMKHRRARRFWPAKPRSAPATASLRMLEKSLELLQTDHLDLWQLHDVGTETDVEAIFAKGGAMEALLQAREQKMVRYLGVTGHFRPDPLMEAIRRHPFDTHPDGGQRRRQASFQLHGHAAAAGGREANGDHRHEGARPRTASFKLDSAAAGEAEALVGRSRGMPTAPARLTMREAMYYTLSLPVSTVIIGCDSIAQLEENVQLARDFTPFSEAQMAAIRKKAEPVSKQALFFRFLKRA